MTMCTIFNKLQSKVDVSYVDEILIILNNALNTRTWSGKVSFHAYETLF